jgi:hypothetical protein
MKISELLIKIWENQEETRTDVSEIKVTLAEQKVILEEHQRRSLANEEAVNILRDQMKPIENHVLMVNFAFKVILSVGGVIGVVASLLKILEFFGH